MDLTVQRDVLPLATALGIGLLIGAERERRKGEGTSRAPAGIRTFALVALTGALALRLGGEAIFAVAFAGVALLAAVGYWRSRDKDPGLTTEIALLLTALLGGAATREPALAAGLAVTVAVLLAARIRLHRFVRSVLSDTEGNDALVLAAATLVVLPLIPDRYLGPFDAINPSTVWLFVVLTMAIGALGHVGQRALGARWGLPIAGFASGFVSSSATIGSMGALAKATPALKSAAVTGAVLSTVATVVHLTIVLAVINTAVLRAMAISLALAGVAAVAYGAIFMLKSVRQDPPPTQTLGHAFSLGTALGIAVVLAAMLLLSAALKAWLGTPGLAMAAAVAGFADAQSAAVAAASIVASGQLEARAAVLPILIGLSTNTITKLLFAGTSGGSRYTAELAPGLALVLAAAWAGACLV